MSSINPVTPQPITTTQPQQTQKPRIEVEENGKITINGVEYKITHLTVGTNQFVSSTQSHTLSLSQVDAIKRVLEETINVLCTNRESSGGPKLDFNTLETIKVQGKNREFKVTTNTDETHPTNLQVTTETCTKLYNAFGQKTLETPEGPKPQETPTPTNLSLQKITPLSPISPSNTPPSARTIRPAEFQTPFSKRLWNMQLLKSNLFHSNSYRFKSGKLQETKNAIETLRAEILNLENIRSNHTKCLELQNYLKTKLHEIEGWLDHRKKTQETVNRIFNINKTQLSKMLLAAEEELGITNTARAYVQNTLKGIRGENSLRQTDLMDQMEQYLKYLTDRGLTYIPEGATGVEETTFNQLHNILFPESPLSADTIILRTDENDTSPTRPVSTSYSTGTHTVNVISTSQNQHSIFDNLSLKPTRGKTIPRRIGNPTGTIHLSENLLRRVDLTDCNEWQIPKWGKNNCYMSSAFMRMAFFDYVRSKVPNMFLAQVEETF